MKDIQGVQRGGCNSCECIEYRTPEESGKSVRCDYCNHTPAEHVRIVELGACKQRDCDCDKYSSEDPNSYTECQYCGCPASQHEGAQALRKPQQQPPSTDTVPAAPASGQMHHGAQAMGQPAGAMTIQPKTSPAGVPVQTMDFGKCSFPDCPFPKRTEGMRLHDYCSRTCAQKHSQMKSSFHHQKLSSAQHAATSSSHPMGKHPTGQNMWGRP